MREPARTRAAANSRYRKHLQRALSCLDASAQWYTAPTSGETLALLIRPQAVPLRLDGGRRLHFGASQLFRIVDDDRFPGEFKVSTQAYVYSLTPDAEQRGKLLNWHWHPQTRPAPHLHVHADAESLPLLGRLHLPSSRVSFEAVVRFLLTDLGAPPAREDAAAVLDDTEGRFVRYRTWHVAPAPGDDPPEPT